MSDARRLATDTVWSLAWAFLATAGAKLSWLAALALLARVLAPEDFGLFAFGLVYVTYAETIGDLGTGAALVYTPKRVEEAAQVTFVFNLAMGVFWFTVSQLAAPWVADFFHNPAGEPILRVLAFSFLVKGFGNTHDALCRKQLRFKARLVPELLLALGKAVLAVTLALAGFGVWSLVWGQLLGVTLWTAALWRVVPWRPGWSLPREMVAPMVRYGRGIVAVDVLAGVVHHADLVVVGRMVGTAALGFYQIASRVPEMTVTLAVWVTGHVLFPAFARLHAAGSGLRDGFLAALRWISLLTLPAATGLVLVAEPLVLTLFGERWRPAVPVLRALAVYTGIRSLGSQAGDVLKATGRPGLLAALGVAKAAVLVPALVLAAPYGAVAVAAALAGVTVLTVLLNLAVVSKVAAVPLRAIARAPRDAAAASALMAAAVWLAGRAAAPLAAPLELALQLAVGLLVYGSALRLLAPEALRQALDTFRGRGRERLAEEAGGAG
jgi:PST family polysaccharide transporter